MHAALPIKRDLPNKTEKIGLFLLVGFGVVTTTAFAYAAASNHIPDKISQVISKSEEFAPLKSELKKTWNTLLTKGSIELSRTDKETSALFVALQRVIEHVLSCELGKEITSLRGIIHTSTSPCILDQISRDLLAKGGHLSIAYPKKDLEKRTEAEQSLYKQELLNYPQHLSDKPLNCAVIPDDLMGATYIFRDKSGREFAFAIKMTQVKDSKEASHFGLWFGPLENDKVSQRVKAVTSFLDNAK